MKNHRFITILGGCLAVLSLSVLGCMDPLNPPPEAPVSTKGSVTVTLAGAGARTLLPSEPDFIYTLNFLAQEGQEAPAPVSGITKAQLATGYGVTLEGGTWKAWIVGMVSADLGNNAERVEVASGESEPFTVTAGQTLSSPVVIAYNLEGVGTGKGIFAWELDSLPPYTETASLKLRTVEGETVTGVSDLDLTVAENRSGSKVLSAGYYLLQVKLAGAGQSRTKTDVLHIYTGLTTKAEMNGEFTVINGPVKVTPVIATPPAGNIPQRGTDISLSCATPGAEIRYTLDDSTPNAASALYTGPFRLSTTTLIQAIAIKEGYANSDMLTANYRTVNLQWPIIDTQPQSGTYQKGASRSLMVTAHATDGGTLSYRWYKNTENSNTGGSPVGTGQTYTPYTIIGGTWYYYVVVTSTKGAESLSVSSETAAITIEYPSLKEKLDALGDGQTLILDRDYNLEPYTISGRTVTLKSDGPERVIQLDVGGSLFRLENSGKLILDQGVSLKGLSNNGTSLVYVDGIGAALTMKTGAKISGNSSRSPSFSSSSSYYSRDGGVCVAGGTFTMAGGEISGNSSSATLSYSILSSSTISATPTTSSSGGGVSVSSGTFIKSGGTIYGYSAGDALSNTVKRNDTVQSHRGHAVYVDSTYSQDTTVTVDQNMFYDGSGSSG